jgi:ABC-2 type transport system ATP-binding protein
MIYGLARGGVTIFVTTHYLDEAEHANRVAMIHEGVLKALASPEELKRTSLRGRLYDLLCDHPIEAVALLEHVQGVEEVALYGTNIHLVLDANRQTPQGIRSVLAQVGIATSAIDEISPSLEDVFISLIDEA